jgi:hypothetical protein
MAVIIGGMVEFSQKIFDDICDRIACGESVNQICKDPNMISRETFYAAMRPDTPEAKALSDKYARAKLIQADYFAEEIIDIADDGRNDWIERENARTGEKYIALNSEAIERSRIRIDARKWNAAKNAPKKYGDKLQQEHTSPDRSMSPSPTVIYQSTEEAYADLQRELAGGLES